MKKERDLTKEEEEIIECGTAVNREFTDYLYPTRTDLIYRCHAQFLADITDPILRTKKETGLSIRFGRVTRNIDSIFSSARKDLPGPQLPRLNRVLDSLQLSPFANLPQDVLIKVLRRHISFQEAHYFNFILLPEKLEGEQLRLTSQEVGILAYKVLEINREKYSFIGMTLSEREKRILSDAITEAEKDKAKARQENFFKVFETLRAKLYAAVINKESALEINSSLESSKLIFQVAIAQLESKNDVDKLMGVKRPPLELLAAAITLPRSRKVGLDRLKVPVS